MLTATMFAADPNIYASGLKVESVNVVAKTATISYYLNADATALEFQLINSSNEVTTVAITAAADLTKGSHTTTVALGDVAVDTYHWALKATANANESFAKVFEHGTTLKRLFATVDNSPESEYMGRIYMVNRADAASATAYVIGRDLTDVANGLFGMSKLQSAGRPSIDSEGYVWWADWGDSHGGLYVTNPATLTTTTFFDGNQASSGVWTNSSGVEMGSSAPGCHVYSSGSNTKVFMANEDKGTTLVANGYLVYNVGQPDGSILRTWNSAPSQKVAATNNDNGNFAIVGTSHGAFLSQHRTAGNNNSSAYSLMFYDNSGTQQYNSGGDTYITSTLGSGLAVSKDETKLILVSGGDILLYDIAWNGDVPTLTYNTT